MTPQELKASILQLAIQGKLVEQRPEEGTGAELLEKIVVAKGAKSAKGAGKSLTRRRGERGGGAALSREKNSAHSAPPREEILDAPFDIPESWVWIRLGDVVFNHGQTKPVEDFSYIDIGSIDNKKQRLSDSETIVHAKEASPRARKIVHKGDVLYATVRPYLHNICVIDRDFTREPIASTGFAVMACADSLHNKYLFYYLLSPDFDCYANSSENAKGVAYPAISDKKLYNAWLPLPPLAEQKRIVAKIEELLPLIDRYEQAWGKLEDFNRRFPVDMQKSLLQMAIQGKLVEQRPEEGTGAELLEKILNAKSAKGTKKSHAEPRRRGAPATSASSAPPREEILDAPFDIPESWGWVRLGEMALKITDGTHKTPRYTDKGIRFVSAKDICGAKLSFDKCKFISEQEHQELFARCNPEKDDLLLSKSGSIGAVALVDVDFEFSLFESLALVKFDQKKVFPKYLQRAVQATCVNLDPERVRGVAVKHLPIADIKAIPIPLPPLAEQKRIVAKLEELLPLCERLK